MIDMNEAKLTTLEQLRQFLAGTAAVVFKPGVDDTRYAHLAEVLRRFQYADLKRPEKGLVLRYLERTTGYSRQQLTRLVALTSVGFFMSHLRALVMISCHGRWARRARVLGNHGRGVTADD